MPLRELALLGVVAAICAVGLVRPKVALFGYIWFAIVQPDVAAWIEGKYPFSLALAICTLVGGARYLHRFPRIVTAPAVIGLLLLQIPIGLSVAFSEGAFLSPDRYFRFEQLTLMILMIPLLLESRRDLKQLIGVLALSECMLGARFGAYGMLQGGVIMNQSYGHLYDNNELALAIVMLVPMTWYARQMTSSKAWRVVLLVVLVASIGAVLMSNSRGSSIGLGAAILFLVWHSKRRLLTVVILAIAIGPAFYLVGDQYLNRMSTIRTYEDDESAANRVDLWHTAWELSQQHPLLGVGFGGRNFAVLEAQYRHDSKPTAVHNSYLSMLVGSGVFAFGLYVTLLFGTIAWLGRCARRLKAEDVAACYAARAIQIALVAYAVGGTFYSHERYDFMYMLLMAAAAFYCVEREHAVEVWQSAEPKLSAVVPSWRTGSLSEHRAQP